jgi:hypothetical protein
VSLPSAINIGEIAFGECPSLVSVNLPSATKIARLAFSGCTALTTVDLGAVTSIISNAFDGCSSLKTLILRSPTIVETDNYLLDGTAIQTSGGFIYVPASLLSNYKTHDDWSLYQSKFRALEDYTVDGTTTGELDPDKCAAATVMSFSINGVTYQFDDHHSTWYEWCYSEYNTVGLVPEDKWGGVYDSNAEYILSGVLASDTIVEGRNYELELDY